MVFYQYTETPGKRIDDKMKKNTLPDTSHADEDPNTYTDELHYAQRQPADEKIVYIGTSPV